MKRSVGDVANEFMRLLLETAAERPQRGAFVDGLPEWVGHERAVMHEAVNAERARNGLPPVPIEDVRRVESRGIGTGFYGETVAVGCAALALGLEQRHLSRPGR